MAVTPNIRKDDYDPLKDFVPMGRIANFPFVIAVRHSFPAKTLDEFVAYVKARPD